MPHTMHKWNNARLLLRIAVITAAMATIFAACCLHQTQKTFHNPVAYTVRNDTLFVVERDQNTVLELALPAQSGRPLHARAAHRIEPDDAANYYMVRKLYANPHGIVAHSYIYDRKTKAFRGYRFREYQELGAPPRDILTVLLKDPQDYPEIYYASDAEGNHYFLNNCPNCRNIWKLPAAAQPVCMCETAPPPELLQSGETNSAFSAWTAICIGSNETIYVLSGTSDRIIEYTPHGSEKRTIGKVGFAPGELLAPYELSFVQIVPEEPPRLTVASSGNRSWVQFDPIGRVLRTLSPLDNGYPFADILTRQIFNVSYSTNPVTFDLVNRVFVELASPPVATGQYILKRSCLTCLLLGAALILLITALYLPSWKDGVAKLRFPFFVKLILLCVPLLILSALTVGDWVRDIMKPALEKETRLRSENLARAVLNNLTETDLNAIRLPKDRESPAYERIHATISRIVDVKGVQETPKWILHKIHEGRFYFGVNIWRGAIFEPYVVTPDRKLFFRALREKTVQSGRFTDEQGEWFSTLSPLTNQNGEVTYILELYRPTEELDRTDKGVIRQVITVASVTALAACLLAFLFSYFFCRPLRSFQQATALISKGNFDHELKIKTRDELSDLAHAFNHMMKDLKRYTHDLAEATAARERIESEVRLAREVQQNMIPKKFPPFAGAESVEIVGRMDPAREIGGDYFDFFKIDNERIGVVIADVSGKGIAAGLFMTAVRALLRSLAAHNPSPANVLTELNRIVANDNPSLMFVTLFYMAGNLRTGAVACSSAGHLPPMLLQNHQAAWMPIKRMQGQGIALGIAEESQYTELTLTLKAGETIALYTDGATECINSQNEMFGEERLRQCLQDNSGLPNNAIMNNIFKEIAEHQRGMETFDDITILLYKYLDHLK